MLIVVFIVVNNEIYLGVLYICFSLPLLFVIIVKIVTAKASPIKVFQLPLRRDIDEDYNNATDHYMFKEHTQRATHKIFNFFSNTNLVF